MIAIRDDLPPLVRVSATTQPPTLTLTQPTPTLTPMPTRARFQRRLRRQWRRRQGWTRRRPGAAAGRLGRGSGRAPTAATAWATSIAESHSNCTLADPDQRHRHQHHRHRHQHQHQVQLDGMTHNARCSPAGEERSTRAHHSHGTRHRLRLHLRSWRQRWRTAGGPIRPHLPGRMPSSRDRRCLARRSPWNHPPWAV